jgi:indole-3-glycerol phosphate synthase
MATILDKIVKRTREDITKRTFKYRASDLKSLPLYEQPVRDFKGALRRESSVQIISEVKKASPSKGLIRPDFDPVGIAKDYENHGASAISVLTDKPFFQGDLHYMEAISKQVSIPVLRKDFIVDPYQITEAKAYGADAILLIVSILDKEQLYELIECAKEEKLSCLVESYSREEFESLDFSKVEIAGVNNRDLNTFEVNLHRGVDILNQAPDHVITVSESGLNSVEDIKYLKENKIDAALIGEHFMRQPSPGKAVSEIIGI